MNAPNHIPKTVAASLEARLAPFSKAAPARPETEAQSLGFFRELKLLFTALGAGTNVVPMGDNTRTARMLAEYAASLRRH
jgi:hypothetical protein